MKANLILLVGLFMVTFCSAAEIGHARFARGWDSRIRLAKKSSGLEDELELANLPLMNDDVYEYEGFEPGFLDFRPANQNLYHRPRRSRFEKSNKRGYLRLL